MGKPRGKQEQTMYKTVFIEIFDVRPVLRFFKPLLASPGYNSLPKGNCRQCLRKILEEAGGGWQTRCINDDGK